MSVLILLAKGAVLAAAAFAVWQVIRFADEETKARRRR